MRPRGFQPWTCYGLSVLGLLFSGDCSAQNVTNATGSFKQAQSRYLAAIKSLAMTVDVSDKLNTYVSREAIRADLEIQLMKSGIKLATVDDVSDGLLGFRVSALPTSEEPQPACYAICVETSLYDCVATDKGKLPVFAWHDRNLIVAGTKKVTEMVTAETKAQLNFLLRDWFLAKQSAVAVPKKQ